MANPWRLYAECGIATIRRSEVRCRRHHVCKDCGRAIERSEYALAITTAETGTVYTEHTCCAKSWH